jgi:RNA polymerase sigma-70 factor, ECF subfamily
LRECAGGCWFLLRRAVCRADTGQMIGAAFQATLTDAQKGDEAAFACLFRDVQPALLRYLRLIAPEAADDVAGETWLQVVAGLAGFRGGEDAFRGWLFTIARHRAVDAGRSRARRRTVPLAASIAAEREAAPDTADVALERISTQAVLALISALPPDQAEIITLRVVAGMDTRAVARLVGKSPGTVRVAAHRGLRRLAATVDRAGVTL